MQIDPQKEFVLSWNGADPSDVDTLYVQAVVKDAKTLSVLNTVNLTDRGSHLFSKSFITPADNSQTEVGRQIFVTLTVYTDAGYTIPSPNYARITDQYIVKRLIDPNRFYGVSGGGYGGEMDYAKLRKLVEEVIDSRKIDTPPVVLKQDFPVGVIVKAIKEEIAKIPSYEPAEEVNLTTIESTLAQIRTSLSSLPMPTQLKDLALISKKIDDLPSGISSVGEEMKKMVGDTMELVHQSIVKSLNLSIENLVSLIGDAVIAGLSQQIKDGKLPLSIFGNDKPFDLQKEKRANYIKSLQAKTL